MLHLIKDRDYFYKIISKSFYKIETIKTRGINSTS